MHEGRTEVRVSSTSNAISVCEEILTAHKEGKKIALMYLGVGALYQAVKSVRRANDHLAGPTPAFLMHPRMERRVNNEGVDWFLGVIALLARQEDGTYK